MITKLDIENFKDLNTLKINNLSQVTLISGKNNIGKTSILEAIILLLNNNQSSAIVPFLANREIKDFSVNRLYNEGIEFETAVSGIFCNHSLSKKISITSNDRTLDICINDATPYKNDDYNSVTDSLELTYFINNIKVNYTSLKGSDGKYKANISKWKPDSVSTFLINEHGGLDSITNKFNRSSKSNVVDLFDSIRKNPQENLKDKLIQGLKLLDKTIEDVEIGINQISKEPQIELSRSTSKPVPLSSFGHGMKRFFNIILATVCAKNGVLLIDEIENGIHYSVLGEMWTLIFELAKLNNCQIIATTHSWEFASYVTNQSPENQKLFSFINIARLKNGELSSATYDYQKFNYAMNQDIEVR